MSCAHHKNGRCTNALALPLYGDNPSAGICRRCEHYDGPDRGLGDTVHRVARATGVTRVVKRVTCGGCGCQKRRESLNDSVPYSGNG
jgi:hypothetical protein